MGAVVAAFILVGHEPLSMPVVQLELKTSEQSQTQSLPPVEDDCPKGTCVEGSFLTHYDGFWYFVEEAKDGEDSKTLAIIPDDQVESVRLTDTSQISP